MNLVWDNIYFSPWSNGPVFLPGVIGFFSIISKGCEASCQEDYQDFKVGNRNVSCCSTNLCNVNAAGSVRSSYGMAAGISASLLWTFLNNRL